MSRCAHEKSIYKLRELPHCQKCKKEMMLVLASYDSGALVYEWECERCHRCVPQNVLQEGKMYPEDEYLRQWCEKNKTVGETSVNAKRRKSKKGSRKSCKYPC